MQFFSSFGTRGDVSSLYGILFLLHIWVARIYVVNVMAAVIICADIYVGLLPHILEWSYQLFVYGNPTSV